MNHNFCQPLTNIWSIASWSDKRSNKTIRPWMTFYGRQKYCRHKFRGQNFCRMKLCRFSETRKFDVKTFIALIQMNSVQDAISNIQLFNYYSVGRFYYIGHLVFTSPSAFSCSSEGFLHHKLLFFKREVCIRSVKFR